MVVESSRAIASVARELGISETSLGNWVRVYREKHAADEPSLQLSERARLRELEREVRELRMKADFFQKPRLMQVITVKYRRRLACRGFSGRPSGGWCRRGIAR